MPRAVTIPPAWATPGVGMADVGAAEVCCSPLCQNVISTDILCQSIVGDHANAIVTDVR